MVGFFSNTLSKHILRCALLSVPLMLVSCDQVVESGGGEDPVSSTPASLPQVGSQGDLVVLQARTRQLDEVAVLSSKGAVVEKEKWLQFRFTTDAEAERIVVTLDGMSDDGDLYVRADEPTSDNVDNNGVFDCGSYVSGVTPESCQLTNNGETDWYISIYGAQETPFRLVVKQHFPDDEVSTDEQDLSGSSLVGLKEWVWFEVDADSSVEEIQFQLTDLSADGDLYVRANQRPTGHKDEQGEYDCGPYVYGTTDEFCELANDGATRWHVGVFGWQQTDFRLTATLVRRRNGDEEINDQSFSLLRTGAVVNHQPSSIDFEESYEQAPFVFARAVTQNSDDLFATRILDVDQESVSLHIQEDTSADAETFHEVEDVAVFATSNNRLHDDSGAVIGELGQVTLSKTLRGNSKLAMKYEKVTLSRSYVNPVVVTSVASSNESSPVVVRLHTVQNDSFHIALQEWPHQDGIHLAEQVNYLVVEAGLHRLEHDGYTLRAGTTDLLDDKPTTINFDMRFVGEPAVFSQVISNNGLHTVSTIQHELTERSVALTMHEESASNQRHTFEQVGFMAVGRHSADQNKLQTAARLLGHGGMGANYEDIRRVATWGEDWWLGGQALAARSKTQPYMDWVAVQQKGRSPARTPDTDLPYFTSRSATAIDGRYRVYGDNFSTAWMRNVVHGDDQLRQRINFHLSQYFVTNYAQSLQREWIGQVPAHYYDTLGEYAFGNFRDLLTAVTLHPLMGNFLTHIGSSKASGDTAPDENYAREVMQLFTIGLWELNEDGSRKLDADGEAIPTYGPKDVAELAKVFTGLWYDGQLWQRGQRLTGLDRLPQYLVPMVPFESYHDVGAKTLFEGKAWQHEMPAGQTVMADIDDALDALFDHPNTPVYFSQRFIQYLVTSNPSPEYVARVSAVFRDNGNGVRGDILATVKAILLDDEAQFSDQGVVYSGAGKLQEPLLRLTRMVKAFNAGLDLPTDNANGIYWWEPTANTSWPQLPMYSSSVFNFFSPFHQPSGELVDNDLYAPELELHNVASAISVPNRFADMIDDRIHRMHPDVTPAFRFDFSAEMAIEGDSSSLLDRLNLLLCNNSMSDYTYENIKSTLDNSSDLSTEQRTKFAVWLVATSADAAVLK